jgi:hypothetical protein
MTCFFFSSFKTLLTSTEGIPPPIFNVLTYFLLAGFEVTINGRFWVTAEGQHLVFSLILGTGCSCVCLLIRALSRVKVFLVFARNSRMSAGLRAFDMAGESLFCCSLEMAESGKLLWSTSVMKAIRETRNSAPLPAAFESDYNQSRRAKCDCSGFG